MNNKNKGFVGGLVLVSFLVIFLVISGYFLVQQKKPKVDTTVSDTSFQPTENIPEVPAVVLEKQIGYIKNIFLENGVNYLNIDYIEMKDCVGGEDCPDGYKIVNNNTLIRKFKISPEVLIKMQTYSNTPNGDFNWNEVVSLDVLKGLISKPKSYWSKSIPFWIELDGEWIKTITEQYLP